MNSFISAAGHVPSELEKGHFTTTPLLASNSKRQFKVTVDDPAVGGLQILGISANGHWNVAGTQISTGRSNRPSLHYQFP
jgi:hypothetical protein